MELAVCYVMLCWLNFFYCKPRRNVCFIFTQETSYITMLIDIGKTHIMRLRKVNIVSCQLNSPWGRIKPNNGIELIFNF